MDRSNAGLSEPSALRESPTELAFSQKAITNYNVHLAVASIIGGSTIKEVTATTPIAPDAWVINIKYERESEDGEPGIIKSTATDMLNLSQLLFSHPMVSVVCLERIGTMIDQYGQKSEQCQVMMIMDQSDAKKIGWDGLRVRVNSDYWNIAHVLAVLKLHPAFLKYVPPEYKDMVL